MRGLNDVGTLFCFRLGELRAMDYEDIINYEYKGSRRPDKMSSRNRAAQFAPFAALSGHDRAIKNTEMEAEYIAENENKGETYYDD